MSAVPTTNWLALILLGSLVLVAIGGAVLVLRRNKLRSRDPAVSGTCGKCGYMVRGLTTFSCPECGADLREVGINPPRTQDNGRKTMFAWVMIVAILICAAIMFAVNARSGYSGPAPPAQPVPAPSPAPASPSP